MSQPSALVAATGGDERTDAPGRPATPLAAIDALRAVAAIGVLLVHVAQVYALRGVLLPWMAIGDAGVQVFFVISGFLITTSVLSAPSFDRRTFLVRRGARILPLYYVSLAVAVLLVDPSPLFTADGRADLAVHLVLLHGLAPGMRYSINGVLWTLTIEVLFYLLVAAAGPLLRRPRAALAAGLAMVVLGPLWRAFAFAVSDGERTTYLIQQLPGAADQLGAGMVLAALVAVPHVRRRLGGPTARKVLLVLSLAALIGVMGVYRAVRLEYWDRTPTAILWPLALSLAVMAFLAAAVVAGRPLHDAARWSGLAFLGTVSYGIYLFHPFVMSALAEVWFARDPLLDAVPYALASLAGTVVIAVMFHYGIERPTMAWGRAVGRPAADAAIAA